MTHQRAIEAGAQGLVEREYGRHAKLEYLSPKERDRLLEDSQACLAAALAAEGLVVVPAADLEKLRSALKGLSDMYAFTWDRVDGGLMMMGSGVERFEKAHQAAYEILNPDAPLTTDDEDPEITAAQQEQKS